MEPKQSLYPKVIDSNPDLHSPFLSSSSPSSSSKPSLYPSLNDPNPNPNPAAPPSSSSSLYPSVEMKDLVDNLFPDTDEEKDPKNPNANVPPPVQETLITIPGAILHLIDKQSSLELASGDFFITRITQSDNVVALVAHIDDIQWPLARDEAVVKLDEAHYFFTLHDPSDRGLFNYGLTFASKGLDKLLDQLDGILESCSSFSKQKVNAGDKFGWAVDREVTPAEAVGEKKEEMEDKSAAYWTTLAPNVEDYGSSVAKVIAVGSGKVIQGILWCGDVTVDRLKWGEDYLRKKMDKSEKDAEVSKEALERMKRFGIQT